MEKITKLDEKLNVEESLKWAREFLGLSPDQSFQDLDVDVDEVEDVDNDR